MWIRPEKAAWTTANNDPKRSERTGGSSVDLQTLIGITPRSTPSPPRECRKRKKKVVRDREITRVNRTGTKRKKREKTGKAKPTKSTEEF